MTLPPHAIDWMSRAEIDYIGPFVKSWAAFNAWYRHVSGERQERAMLNFIISKPNSSLRRHILPMLDTQTPTAEAQGLRQAIYDLHLRLDAIQFEVSHKEVTERISLRSVCIEPRHSLPRPLQHNRHEFKAVKIQGGSIEVTVTVLSTGAVKFKHVQSAYDTQALFGDPDFAKLSDPQQTKLREYFGNCNPRPMSDLVHGAGPALSLGAADFRCTPEALLAGLIEVIYAMRNALLHGEIDPDKQILACYEPAYRIVMTFLRCAA